MSLHSFLRFLQPLRWFEQLAFKGDCSLCQRACAQPWCDDCQRQVQRCQLSDPMRYWQSPQPVFAWGDYSGALKRAIATLKYNNRPDLARPLGYGIGQAWRSSSLARTGAIVVPIPMHSTKQQQRGFNQAELLADAFCAVTRLPLCRDGLLRVRTTEAQFGLSVASREQNLAGAFEVGDRWRRHSPRQPILLLDDIYTTGATARSAVQAFSSAGVPVLGIVTLAKPQLSHDGSESRYTQRK
jgi:ComF family protein